VRTLVLLGAMGLASCATAHSFQTADTVGRDGWEVGVDGSGVVMREPNGPAAWPFPRLGGRVGVSERTEVVGSVGFDGVKGGARVQLSTPGADGPVASVGVVGKSTAPFVVEAGSWGGLEETVYVGFPWQDVQLVLHLRSAQDLGWRTNPSQLWFGGGGGVSWRPGMGRWRLMPEAGAMAPTQVDPRQPQRPTAYLGLGVAYGRRR
jgi:hypothetical protein